MSGYLVLKTLEGFCSVFEAGDRCFGDPNRWVKALFGDIASFFMLLCSQEL